MYCENVFVQVPSSERTVKYYFSDDNMITVPLEYCGQYMREALQIGQCKMSSSIPIKCRNRRKTKIIQFHNKSTQYFTILYCLKHKLFHFGLKVLTFRFLCLK